MMQQQLRMAEPNWRRWSIAAIIGLVIFLTIQIILPLVSESISDSSTPDVIAETEAERKALTFIESHFGDAAAEAAAVHQSQSQLGGYLAKEKLSKSYQDTYGSDFPIDTWQVEVRGRSAVDGGIRTRFVYVHMETGEVIAWNEAKGSVVKEGRTLDFTAASLAARAFAVERGFRDNELTVRDTRAGQGAVMVDVTGARIGDAKLTLRIRAEQEPDGAIRIVEYKPAFETPDGYKTYVERQDKIAENVTMIGSMGLSFVLFILAIVYAILYRGHTSFARGLLLSGAFLLFYIVNTFNMYDGFRATLHEELDAASTTNFLVAFQLVFTIGIAASVYFAFVAGDGLWRSMGRSLWLRRGEQGFGADAWRGMKIGYLAAFIFLGLQAVFFIVVENGFGVWSTSDPSQSPLNFGIPLLFPLLAWSAAISEEAMYRLFGIGLFRKWFKHTAAAAIIPTIIWALGHVAYPIYPWSTRLIELTLLGLLFCWLFVRYGFAAALFAHAVFDLVLMAIAVMFLGGTDNIIAGIFYIVHPVGLAWLIYAWDRKRPKRTAASPPAAGAADTV